jgi:hypothetical protein
VHLLILPAESLLFTLFLARLVPTPKGQLAERREHGEN